MFNSTFNYRKPDFWYCVASAALLILSFPTFNLWFLIWVALVPLLVALQGRSAKEAFRRGYFCGLLFYGGTLFWFIDMHQTAEIPWGLAFLAVAAFVAYLALYFGIFAWGYVKAQAIREDWRIFYISGWWVILECVRAYAFSGFGWLALGHSQFERLLLIQSADLFGVYGLSFLVVMMNVSLFRLVSEALSRREMKRGAGRRYVLWAVALLLVFAVYGFVRIRQLSSGRKSVRVAVIQGNIPQVEKYSSFFGRRNLDRHLDLSRTSLGSRPDVIIWPETSYPGFMWDNPGSLEEIKDFVKDAGVPLIFGAATREGVAYYNSAILVFPDGQEIRHHKMHLVPFGEYLPLRRRFPILSYLVPIVDFSSGTTATMFPVAGPDRPLSERMAGHFGVLICFEDTVVPVARRLVRAGAEFLVNMTNDAWFLNPRAPWMHTQTAVFQAVSLRRTLVRAANTGVSGIIYPSGRIGTKVQDGGQATFVEGVAVGGVPMIQERTFYAKWGEAFVLLLAAILGVLFLCKKSRIRVD